MSASKTTVEKWRVLVDRIIYATDLGKISWKESSEDSVYVTRIGDTQISYEESDSPDEINKDYTFRIYNSRGEVIDFFNDSDLYSRDENIAYYPRMRELYNRVVRQTNGSDIVLDRILASLDDPDIPF